MSFIALYRKYRPQSFAEVLGQDHIIEVLKESVKSGDITHSYLFFGSRGTGKTSVARILAREIGCEPEDLYEIDAASNRGIDDVRELREGVKTLPFKSPYKVYIIDEVHMLTKEAFNALLKTLEEPPKHAVFVLATTEVGKVPETVISRCQTFTFKKPTHALLKKSATEIARKEGYSLEPSAADLVAVLGDGSFRDTQGILHLVLSAVKGKTIGREFVEKITNAPPAVLVNEFVKSLAHKNLEDALGAVRKATETNVDFMLFLKLILEKMRLVLLTRFDLETKKKIKEDFSEDDILFFETLAGKEGLAINSEMLGKLLDAYSDTNRAYIKQLPLELALIELLDTKGK
ncbi:MAG: DNA polymerase III subunit gamma/tau [Parcubacteria group bacterium]|nr:DNA polymerase III subunit gamma/tau [Parcubacteria group bacterium]